MLAADDNGASSIILIPAKIFAPELIRSNRWRYRNSEDDAMLINELGTLAPASFPQRGGFPSNIIFHIGCEQNGCVSVP